MTNPDAIGDELGQDDALNPQVGEIQGDRGGLAVALAVGSVVGLLKEGHDLTFANGEITHYLRDHGYAIKVPPTWRDLYASGQKLMRNGVDAARWRGGWGSGLSGGGRFVGLAVCGWWRLEWKSWWWTDPYQGLAQPAELASKTDLSWYT